MADQRIYKVTSANKEHLVQATSQAQALRHIAGKYYTVEVAKSIDVARLMNDGTKLEVAAITAEQADLGLEGK